MELSVENIIKNEKVIINQLKRELKYSTCVECTRSAIEYHEMIIYYLESALQIAEHYGKILQR